MKLIFAVLCVSLNDGPYNAVIKRQLVLNYGVVTVTKSTRELDTPFCIQSSNQLLLAL